MLSSNFKSDIHDFELKLKTIFSLNILCCLDLRLFRLDLRYDFPVLCMKYEF
jgi:hypothetical protein